jgi:hypothetical protein
MSTTITLPPDLEEKLAGRAAASGKVIEGFVLEALERIAELPTIREFFADVRGQIQKGGISDEELDARSMTRSMR